MRSIPALVLSLGLLVLPLGAQCIPTVNAPNSDPTTGVAVNVFPFGQTAGFTYVSQIPAAFMDTANTYVNDISFAPGGTGTWSCGTIVIALGHVANPFPNPFNFPTVDAAGNLLGIGSFNDLTVVYNSFTQGPFSWNATLDTWSPLGFAAAGGTGFTWNGVDDVAFFITFQAATATGWTGGCRRETLLRSYGTGFNIPTATTNASTAALKIRFDVVQGPGLPGIPTWQCNQPSSSATVNGAADPGPSGPIVTTLGVGSTAFLGFGGLGGQPFDLAVTIPEPGVPVGGGGFLTPGLQAVNINLFAPSFFLLFGGTFTNSFFPFTVPVAFPAPLSVSFQQIVLDPANPDGFALSHLNELNWVQCSANENWDALPLGLGIASPGWSNPGAAGTQAWTVDAAGTPSAATGPTIAFNGANYAYCETSGFTNTTFTFDTCPANAATLITGVLSFELSAIGATIGTLNVYQGDGSGLFGPTPIFTQTGAEPGQSQGGVEWTNKSIPLTLTSPFVNFRFEYISGTSFTGDLAVDDIQVN